MVKKIKIEKLYEAFLSTKIIEINTSKKFWWASGILSPIYTDNRLIYNYPEFRTMVETGLAQLIQEKYPNVNKIMGVATAGIGHGAIVAHILGLPFSYARTVAKDHGKKNQFEGKIGPEDKVVVIEDLVSTGKSVSGMVENLRANNVQVEGVASIFSYELSKSECLFKATNTKYCYLIGINGIMEYGAKHGYVTKEQANEVITFIKSLKNFGKTK